MDDHSDSMTSVIKYPDNDNVTSVFKYPDNDSVTSVFKYPEQKNATVLFVLLHVTILCVNLFSNFCVITVIVLNRRLHRSMNFYIVSLCMADFLVAIVLPCYIFLQFFTSRNTAVMCHAFRFMRFTCDFSVVVSVYSMVGIAADRYRAVMEPLQPAHTRRQAAFRISLIWLWGLLYALVWALGFPGEKHPEYSDVLIRCEIRYEDDHGQAVYINFFDIILLYLLPLTISSVLYVTIIKRLWSDTFQWASGSHGTSTVTTPSVSGPSLLRKRRAIKMAVTILCVFATLWLPYHCLHLYFLFEDPGAIWRWTFPIINILFFSNSWIDCFIYAYFSNSFRRVLHKSFKARLQRSRTFSALTVELRENSFNFINSASLKQDSPPSLASLHRDPREVQTMKAARDAYKDCSKL